MGKLKTAPPRIGRLAPRVGRVAESEADRSRVRDRSEPWRAWYKTARWQRLRWSVLVRDGFTCAMCGRLEGDTSKLVCDHVDPHRGDEAKFWAGPFQTLCKGCHDGEKQRSEAKARRMWS